ncbi:unnamed protein product [Urochloa decumbens]|uniref:DUF1618 domain-containing protein n=1 Tax=Urochloa decumbens TaxID=240449 RepID=A0ABC9B802_9POAL
MRVQSPSIGELRPTMELLLRPFGGLHSSGRSSLFNRARPSSPCLHGLPPSFLQSRRRRSRTDPVPCRRQMQTLTHATASNHPSGSPAPAQPRWVILDRWGIPRDSSNNIVADDKTAAEYRTSSGRPIRVYLSNTALPPEISFICVDPVEEHVYVIAAHGDSVLFQRNRVVPKSSNIWIEIERYQPSNDYFGYIHWDEDFTARYFNQGDTGILCRSDNELLVAQLRIANDAPFDTAQLCVLRPGRREWELNTAVPIVHHDGGGRHDLQKWQDAQVVVPVGDRFLCWVNFDCSTFLLCDMVEEEEPELRYVPLPVKPFPPRDDEDYDDCYDEQPPWLYYRSIGAVGPSAVRFVSIDNRNGCGGHLTRWSCEHSSSAFVVTMWTLTLRTGKPMMWMREAVLECEEVWSLAACKGLPQLHLMSPVVSMENPDVVCFIASHEGDLLWTVDIDVKRKTLISATPCPAHPVKSVNYCNPLTAKLQSP